MFSKGPTLGSRYQPGRHCQLLPLSLRHLHRAGWSTFLAFKQGIDVYIISSSVGWIDTDTHICMILHVHFFCEYKSINICLRSVENVGMSRISQSMPVFFLVNAARWPCLMAGKSQSPEPPFWTPKLLPDSCPMWCGLRLGSSERACCFTSKIY